MTSAAGGSASVATTADVDVLVDVVLLEVGVLLDVVLVEVVLVEVVLVDVVDVVDNSVVDVGGAEPSRDSASPEVAPSLAHAAAIASAPTATSRNSTAWFIQ